MRRRSPLSSTPTLITLFNPQRSPSLLDRCSSQIGFAWDRGEGASLTVLEERPMPRSRVSTRRHRLPWHERVGFSKTRSMDLRTSGRNVINPARVSRQDTRLVARWAGPRIRPDSRLRFLLTQLFRSASRRVWSAPWPAHLRTGCVLRPHSRLRLPFAQPRPPEARRVPVRYQKTKGSDPPPERWQ